MTTLNQTLSLPVKEMQDLKDNKDTEKVTIDEFFAYIRKNPNERVELVNGCIVPMTGGTSNHSLIAVNCLARLHLGKKNPNCNVYNGDFGVQTKENQVRYPDFFIACNVGGDDLVTSNPILIGEVLSNGNTKKEISNKIDEYKNLHSVQEIVLVSQKTKEITIHRRGKFFGWSKEVYTSGIIVFKSIDYSVDIEDLYMGVEFKKK